MQVIQHTSKTNTTDGKLILYQAYETSNGIFDYLNQAMMETQITDVEKKRPLSSVAFHPAEDFSNGSKLYEMIGLFMDLNIYTSTGLSLTEFLELPDDIVQHVIKKRVIKRKEEEAEAAKLRASLGNK
jgi:hypothetical protein